MLPEPPPTDEAHRQGSRITRAEDRVLTALCRGASNRSIAARLVLSPRTVESHISSLLLKTGCHSRTQLVLWALERQGSGRLGPDAGLAQR